MGTFRGIGSGRRAIDQAGVHAGSGRKCLFGAGSTLIWMCLIMSIIGCVHRVGTGTLAGCTSKVPSRGVA